MVSSTHSVMALIPFQSFEKKNAFNKSHLNKKEKKLMMVEEVSGTENCFEWLLFTAGIPILDIKCFFHLDATMGCLTFILWKIFHRQRMVADLLREHVWISDPLSELLYNSHFEWFWGEKFACTFRRSKITSQQMRSMRNCGKATRFLVPGIPCCMVDGFASRTTSHK